MESLNGNMSINLRSPHSPPHETLQVRSCLEFRLYLLIVYIVLQEKPAWKNLHFLKSGKIDSCMYFGVVIGNLG